MEIRFKENPLWKITGVIWLFVTLMHLGTIIFVFTRMTVDFGLVLSPFYVIIILISAMSTVYYFKLKSIDYIRINDTTISIHKGIVFPRKTIAISEIEQGRIVGDKFMLILKNDKEEEINLKQITIKNFERMQDKLKEHFIIS